MRRLLVPLLATWLACSHTPAPPPPPAPAPAAPARPAQVRLRLVALNDLHGNLEPPSGGSGRITTAAGPVAAGGVAYLATHLKRLAAEAPHSLIVSAGDMIGASPLVSAAFHDEPTIEAMNLAGLAVNAVGNHEFDDGPEELLRLQRGGCHPKDGCADGTPFEGARFHFLAANVLTADGKTLFPAYEVREVDGVKVGFIGLTLEGTPTIVDPKVLEGLTFLDEVEAINRASRELTAQGVHAQVVLVHEGGVPPVDNGFDGCVGLSGPIVDIVKGVDRAVDAVHSAHTHQAYNCVLDGRPVTSAASFGRLVTTVDLTLDRASGDVVQTHAENHVVTRDVAPDPEVQQLVARYAEKSAPLRARVVGELTAPAVATNMSVALAGGGGGDYPLGRLVADVQLEATQKSAGAQLSFMNPGGIRADLDAGPVTYDEAFTLHPFGNTLVTVTLSGAQLLELLEQQFTSRPYRMLQPSQGFTYAWSEKAPVGHKVDPRSVRVAGKRLVPTARYRVTVNSFLAGGGDGFTVLARATEPTGGPVDVDALEAYLARHRPLTPPAGARIRRLP